MFCPNCGEQLPDGSKFCGNCGYKIESAPSAPKSNFKKKDGLNWREARKAAALPRAVIDLIFGTIATIWALVTYSNDTSRTFGGYNYSSPLTGHEVLVIVLGIGGVAALICGLINLIVYVKTKS